MNLLFDPFLEWNNFDSVTIGIYPFKQPSENIQIMWSTYTRQIKVDFFKKLRSIYLEFL